jgi:hypothetical protein
LYRFTLYLIEILLFLSIKEVGMTESDSWSTHPRIREVVENQQVLSPVPHGKGSCSQTKNYHHDEQSRRLADRITLEMVVRVINPARA